MEKEFLIERFGERLICLRGVGKMFYQDGFPISLAVNILRKKGVEVSILHVADECLKNGWSPKTTYNKLKADFEDDDEKSAIDLLALEKFCNAGYDDQREMVFQYLFNTSSEEARKSINNTPLNWCRKKVNKNLQGNKN